MRSILLHKLNGRLFTLALVALAVFATVDIARAQDVAAENARWSSQSLEEADLVSVADHSQVLNQAVDCAHSELFRCDPYPSAKACAKCHPQHFREWSVSPHAYAQLSPVFNAMSNKLIELTNGTLGDFCIRCHTPVGMALNEPINMSNLYRHTAAREGVTCISCHRVNQAWGKGAGRQALVPGDVTHAVYGPRGSDILQQVLSHMDEYGALSTTSDTSLPSRKIHRESVRFFEMTTSSFCGSCHDVFAPNGFRLEDAFSEFKHSPAADCGKNCQDCHMGKTPGKAEGYDCAPAAIVGNRPTPSRKHTNHMMVGPDYSIVHPGIFPHNIEAVREPGDHSGETGLATLEEWLMFNDREGWGQDEFEAKVQDDNIFPLEWKDSNRRRRARRILDDQKKLLREADLQRHQLLRAGYHLGEIEVVRRFGKDFKFRVPVSNITDGHGVPTGFDAERLVYVRTQVWDSNGCLIFQSGDLDPNGDLRDSHSLYVHNGEVPLDRHLFSLQSRFITRNVRGGEREQVLNIPYSLDPLPYLRPETRPFTVLGRPTSARKQKQNIEVGGHRYAEYSVPNRSGPLSIRVQLIAGMVPVNLIHEISSVGFDYGMSAREVANAVVAGHLVLYERTKVVK
ncbi:multiheme c-type cytochrome [Thalassoglobus sp. JC818]|uniref:multiheme c-type cytochrome n=1 Tax=Thalassoglobus sp. JC818 TaxID=3232136 RepID=UPI00345941B2